MNFVFISPNFPRTYWHFCAELKNNGANVLGVGDCPYDQLEQELRGSLTEYYKVDSLEDYGSVFRAVAFFSFKYGKIDWLESNNEYWLETDARLRSDFNITTGVKAEEIGGWKRKSEMKKYYALGNIPTARCHRVKDEADTRRFIRQVGYPVIVKPDVGVGAADTYKLESDEDLRKFFAEKPEVPYVCEEFIEGDIYSYDAIADGEGRPLFESSSVFPPSIMDIVLTNGELSYYTLKKVPAQLKALGRRALKSFGVKCRFVHMEFFRLTKARKGLGEVGDFVGLEVNMRPAGGYTPDMMNFAHYTDVYKIWADMVCFGERRLPESGEDCFCIYSSRRDCWTYVHSHEEVMKKYAGAIVMAERMPDALASDMGNQMYTARFNTMQEVHAFVRFITERAAQ
ncbi:MAG: ATP-grasp domain-containing protein [Oscillospiraceae bacterium]|nr:ATP-grasp domain-containing protein [Oscillospiraceae bacterium]